MRSRIARAVTLSVLMAALLATLTFRMVQLQIIEGPEASAQVNANAIRTYTEIASRGEILDRNGTPMVSNGLGFSIQLDYYQWKKATQNDVLLSLWDMLQQAGIQCNDILPLSQTQPLSYTYDSLESGAGKKLQTFVTAREWGSVEALTPSRLMGLLCSRYGVDVTLPLEQRRAIVGLRYYLEDYQFSSYNTPVTVASDVDISTVALITERAADLPGVDVQVSGSRKYDTPYAAHLLGRVASISPEEYAEKKDQGYSITDVIGKDGMEQALESYLRGTDGTRAVEVDRQTGSTVAEYMVDETVPGSNCFLTIDLDLQKVAEDSLAETMANIKKKGQASKTRDGADAEGGSVVVLDINTGEILAMASYPTYSLENYRADFAANSTDPLSPFLNRTIASAVSPGSTFKMCTTLAALEEGIITPYTTITDKGVYDRYADVGYAPRCWIYRQHGRTHGTINVSQALKYSCNYFFYEMGYQLGIERIQAYATQLGLGQKTGVELSNETAGILAGPEERADRGGQPWYGADTLMAAIGQSDNQFSPLQIVNYVATVVNGGTRYQPHLLKEVKDYTNSETTLTKQPTVLNTVTMAESTLQAIKKGMKGVVTEDGTASSYFSSFPIAVGGKTGSAQMINHSATGIFVSFAPYDDPQIAICVVGEYTSSGGALAPVAIAVYNQYFKLGLFDQPETETNGQGGATAQTGGRQNATQPGGSDGQTGGGSAVQQTQQPTEQPTEQPAEQPGQDGGQTQDGTDGAVSPETTPDAG